MGRTGDNGGNGELAPRATRLAPLCFLSLLLFNLPAFAAVFDGALLDVRNAAEARRRLGITNQYTFVASSNILITVTDYGTNQVYTFAVVGVVTNVTSVTAVDGITNLNGLTNLSQMFAAGTSGTDFAIASAAGVHTFNLPTASASVRGALSSADWTTFNGKQGSIAWQSNGNPIATAPTTVSLSNATLMALNGSTLNIVPGGSATPVGNSGAVQFADTGAFDGNAN